ncbi:ABC transporter permease [Amaricoccus tamworthensis]|uniref:ABC transporter permease n=1 Tax=Amaricoccus tamworthensis TaxID=57002 RepID=UPI003C79D74B
MPALGGETLSLQPWHDLFAVPGILRSALLSLGTGLAATLISVILVILIVATFQGTRGFRRVERVLSPLLSVPHAAAAFGLAFLIAPSGWLSRLLSPWLTGWNAPPDLLIIHDTWGLTLIGGLVIKEVPFLLLMTIAALPQADASRTLAAAMTLGYGRVSGWCRTVLPRVYPQIRLPVYAVLAFSMSTVEVALILGPTTPATLAVRVTGWMRDPDLTLWFQAAAGATLQLALVLFAFLLWRFGETVIARLALMRIMAGHRGRSDWFPRAIALVSALAVSGAVFAGLVVLGIWSFAGFWRFPDALPQAFSLKTWMRSGDTLLSLVATGMGIAVASVVVALILVLYQLQQTTRLDGSPDRGQGMWLIYLPLILPQIAFLLGLQILSAISGLDGTHFGVFVCHLMFVLPYVYLSLSDPWRALNPRFSTVAATLGSGPWRIFWWVRLPLMLTPILTAAAVGLAVSLGLYLPTLLIGVGRVTTLTTEAVALTAGGDRRLIGVYGLLQAILPFIGFGVALAVPRLVWRNRRAMEARQ